MNVVGKHTADTALGMAAREGQHAMLQLLLSHGADVRHADHHQGYTVLHWAAHMGHLAIARMLVDAGCNPLARDCSQHQHLPRFVCMRDVKDKYTPLVCTFLRPSCVQKTRLTNDSEVSFPSNRRISAICGWWCWAFVVFVVCVLCV